MTIINTSRAPVEERGLWPSSNRVEALSDGIFAIAMTVLVLTIDVPPETRNLAGTALADVLKAQWHQIFNYGLSFALLAIFWVICHQQGHYIRRSDHYHLWVNILILLFVALLPFPTSLVGDFPAEPAVQFIFGLNMLILGLLVLGNWCYAAYGRGLLQPDTPRQTISLITAQAAIIPLVSLLGIGLSLSYPVVSSFVYLLIPGLLLISHWRDRHNPGRREDAHQAA